MKLKNTKLLIVDDDESHRQMLKAVLSEEGVWSRVFDNEFAGTSVSVAILTAAMPD